MIDCNAKQSSRITCESTNTGGSLVLNKAGHIQSTCFETVIWRVRVVVDKYDKKHCPQ